MQIYNELTMMPIYKWHVWSSAEPYLIANASEPRLARPALSKAKQFVDIDRFTAEHKWQTDSGGMCLN